MKIKKIRYYISFYLLVPVVFFVILETSLRLADYGYPSGFFIKQAIGDRVFFVNNYKFSWQFFPKPIARLSASVKVPVVKDHGALRVFVLGESAAMGDPDPAFSFSRYLQAMLEIKYPDKKIEIYNTALTAINSNVLLPVFYDCLELNPDLIILYTGNNEVIGPFGLSDALAPYTSSRFLIKARIKAGQTKTGQMLQQWTTRPAPKDQSWRGMKMFMNNSVPFNDPKLENIYDHFDANIKEMCEAAAEKGVKVILSTVLTNELDCPPFMSLHDPSLSRFDYSEWQSYYDNGIQLQKNENFEGAIAEYIKAYQLDSLHAELNYRLGRCYFQLGDIPLAKKILSAARDLDALRFRTDSRMNNSIRSMGEKKETVFIVDAEREVKKLASGELLGRAVFYEHVHLNAKGNFYLSSCILPTLEKALGLSSDEVAPSIEQCEKRLAYSAFDQYRIDEINLSRVTMPPFSNQYTNADDIAFLKNELAMGERAYHQDSTYKFQIIDLYDKAIDQHAEDLFLHLNYLKFLHAFQYKEPAFKEASLLFDLLPYEYLSSVNKGLTSMELHDFVRAEKYLNHAIELNPYFNEAYEVMAVLYEKREEFYRVEFYLNKSGSPTSALAEFYNRAGLAFAKRNKLDSALVYFTKAVSVNPNLVDAQQNLVMIRKKINLN